MDDNTFWLRFYAMIISGVVIISLGMSGCVIHSNIKLAEAIKNGASPIEASIAFSSSNDPSVTLAALLKK